MDIDWIKKLAAAAARAPSADNSQPWTLGWNGTELAIRYALRDKTHNLFAAESHATLLAVGAVVEYIQVALNANPVSFQWQWPSNPALGQPYASVALSGTSTNFASPQALSLRHTNRFAFRADALPANLFRELGNYRENDNRASCLIDLAEKSRLIRLVRICSEARFCNPKLHEWLINSLRFTPEDIARGDGLDIESLALPPGGKFFFKFISDWKRMSALNGLGLYKLLARSEVSLLAEAPALLCIIGRRSDPRSIIDGGRLMTRLWVDLNEQGIAVHPYYVVSDQINRFREGTAAPGFETKISEVEEEIRELLALQSDEMLHMIMRVGYPKTEPVRSRRLPLESVFMDATSI
ncbi:hypothetical protein [Nitrosovibrio sp. Nv4]|uniref:hypothetical protein n=1 Tax=Nitrosovibrio sp. Nv4 TaxID=1945880 RepID=UPI000BC6040A|nr:hypothetical protein [Nitrosovibrio sp. Nv4]SOD40593.1 Nitroreductase family protein [Nitrosovibrio sp. Nv4]